ncbi:UDP-N-acetyl-D-mannosamine dehydrogenase [Agromyces lapidis]|uniref:UDP-N-acetyl-D-mannosamine dehydrogenase n=1 Tax=Agromyces lapidis TaxID=279574 RepID=A0ABV5SR77_9MICO|nr:UDP-N-acetyl-D-mannosamine dehydrogenase [Agromyces lapidis]
MHVSIIGLGYIGLPTAVALANAGVKVRGVDLNEAVVRNVNDGILSFVEPGLAEQLANVVDAGLLTAGTAPESADVFVVAVPTPFNGDRTADLRAVEAATRSLSKVLHGGELVILESTSPPGTTERMVDWVAEERPDLMGEVDFAHCPERVLPGQMMRELVENGRIVGGLTLAASLRAKALYESFCRGTILTTDARTAELVKLVENAYRDVNIAFANEISLISDQLSVNTWEVIELANQHPRVNILNPGPGVGGHCIAVDPWFIVEAAPSTAKLIRLAREVNDAKPDYVVQQVADAAGPSTSSIAVLGLAFKKNVDDLRGSPAIDITRKIADRFPTVALHVIEPHIAELPAELRLPNVTLESTAAIGSADIVLLLVDHDQFQSAHTYVTADATVIDTRGQWGAVDLHALSILDATAR